MQTNSSPSARAVDIDALPWAVRRYLRFSTKRTISTTRSPPAQDQAWTLKEELRRQDEIARMVVPVGLAGAAATASVAVASGAGQYRALLFAVSVALTIPALLAILALATAPYVRDESSVGPIEALQDKVKLNQFALLLLWLTVFIGAIAAVGITLY